MKKFSSIALFILIISQACSNGEPQQIEIEVSEIDPDTTDVLKEIQKRGKLIALTDYNTTNYFIYRGTPMGYHYDILQRFADHLGIPLELKIEKDIDKAFQSLENGKCDIMAWGLTVTKNRKNHINFVKSHIQTRQVLVQAYPKNWRKARSYDDLEEFLIRNVLTLAGKTVVIQKGSIFKDNLIRLSNDIGDSINIVEDDRDVEELIAAVARGEIDYTISDEHVAKVNKKFYPNIDVETPVSFPQKIAWAVRSSANTSFLDTINNWMDTFNDSRTAKLVYNKYFKNRNTINIAKSSFHSVTDGKLSNYDKIIKKIALENNTDWRLIASVIYQESQFNPESRSWMGAYGLMQLMPMVMEAYKVDTNSSAEDHIRAGVEFLFDLKEQLPKDIKGDEERLQFALAAYNAGIAHVYDARRLAQKNNKNPNLWDDNVDFFLLNKSKPKYYRDPVVKYGYCRGQETYNFVNEILERYNHYKNLID
ncbi:MAG: transglycosylase SLT domain-containing protein [Hyphomicrobiales bacterium]